MKISNIGLGLITPLGAYHVWNAEQAGMGPLSKEWDNFCQDSTSNFQRGGFDQIISKIQPIVVKLFTKDTNHGDVMLPFFLAVYYWLCHKINVIDVNQPESSQLMVLRDQLLDAFVNMRYPGQIKQPKESFLGLMKAVHETLVSIGRAQENDSSWQELGAFFYEHRFLLEATLINIACPNPDAAAVTIQCNLVQQMMMVKKIMTHISQDLENLLIRISDLNLFDHEMIRECFFDFREDAKRAVSDTEQEIAEFKWELMEYCQNSTAFFSEDVGPFHRRFYFFSGYPKKLIELIEECMLNPDEPFELQFDKRSPLKPKVPSVFIQNKNALQVLHEHLHAQRRLHLDYDAKISTPRFHIEKIITAIREAKKAQPRKWTLEWPKALQEWHRRIGITPAQFQQEQEWLKLLSMPSAKKKVSKVKHSKPKAPLKISERKMVIKTDRTPSIPERSISSIIEDVQPSGLSTNYTINALKQARIYEIDLLLLKQILVNQLPKEHLTPVSILAIRVSALYLEQLFRSEVLDWKNDPEASLKIHNLRAFDSHVAKKAEGLVNSLFLAHYWVDYPEEQWKKWINANETPPKILSQMQNDSNFDLESAQALVDASLKVGRIWIEETTKGRPIQQLLNEGNVSFIIPMFSLKQINKKIKRWSLSEQKMMSRQLRMIEFCFKAPFPMSFQIRHGLHWMQLSLEYALRIAVQRKTGAMARSHDLFALAAKAEIQFTTEESAYLTEFFQKGRQMSSYLYDWADPEKPFDRLLLALDQGKEIDNYEVLERFMSKYVALLSKLII